jgi:hypothetical protein
MPAARLTSVLAIVATVVTVAACNKPVTRVTVQSGSTSVLVSPGVAASISAKSGQTIMVDVPSEVANTTWNVDSIQQTSATNVEAVPGEGLSVENLRNRHSVRLNVPTGSGTYLLVVSQGSPQKPDRTWITKVTVSA